MKTANRWVDTVDTPRALNSIMKLDRDYDRGYSRPEIYIAIKIRPVRDIYKSTVNFAILMLFSHTPRRGSRPDCVKLSHRGS